MRGTGSGLVDVVVRTADVVLEHQAQAINLINLYGIGFRV